MVAIPSDEVSDPLSPCVDMAEHMSEALLLRRDDANSTYNDQNLLNRIRV